MIVGIPFNEPGQWVDTMASMEPSIHRNGSGFER
jgi:hypothetical protein